MILKDEEVVAYLPHNVYFLRTVENVDCSGPLHLPCVGLGTYRQQETQLNNVTLGSLMNDGFKEPKLLLIPLETFPVTEDMFGGYNSEYPDEFRYEVENGMTEYNYMVELFKAHVDVFGLIKRGLAVDKTKI